MKAFITSRGKASVESCGDHVFLSCSKVRIFVATHVPSYGRWYQHLSTRLSTRTGDLVQQDRAATLKILHKLLEMYEQEWLYHRFEIDLEVLSAARFLIITCCGGMQGYEAVWTDPSAHCYDVSYCEYLEDFSAISWPLMGRFKSRNGVADCYMIPITGVTCSGIQVFVSQGGQLDQNPQRTFFSILAYTLSPLFHMV